MSTNQDDSKKKNYDSLESYKSDREWFKPRKKIIGYKNPDLKKQESLSFATGTAKPIASFKINYKPENIDAFQNFIIQNITESLHNFLEPWLNNLIDIEESNPNNFFSRKRMHPWKSGEYIGFNFLSYDLSKKLHPKANPKILLNDAVIVKMDSDLSYYLRKNLYWYDQILDGQQQMKNISIRTVALTMDLSQLQLIINAVFDDVFQKLNLPPISKSY